MKRTRVGLFGGTFDPAHAGHLAMAKTAREAAGLDRVVLIPCRISPHKLDGPPPTCGEDRMEMLRLAFQGVPWAVVDGSELPREGPSYSWQTAAEFHAREPQAQLFWIMGEDQWEALPGWSHPERLAERVRFLVFTRGGRTPQSRDRYRAEFLPAVHPASATAIRGWLAHGRDPGDWLAPRVADWIRARGLYRK